MRYQTFQSTQGPPGSSMQSSKKVAPAGSRHGTAFGWTHVRGRRNFMIGGCLRCRFAVYLPAVAYLLYPMLPTRLPTPSAPRTIKRRFVLPFQPLGDFKLDLSGMDRVLIVPLIGFFASYFAVPALWNSAVGCLLPVPGTPKQSYKRIIFDSFRNAERALADGIGVFILSAASSVPLFLGSWKYASCLALSRAPYLVLVICAEALVFPRFVDHYVIYPSGNGQ